MFNAIVAPQPGPEHRMSIALNGNDLTFSQLYAVALRGEAGFAGARGDRADECFARGRRSPGRVRRDGVRNQYRIRKTCFGAHFDGAGAATAGESGALARVRRGRAAERSGDARDDAAARECARERIERRAAACRRDTLPDAECESASGDSFARFGGRFGRSGAAGASGAGGDWRRPRELSAAKFCPAAKR